MTDNKRDHEDFLRWGFGDLRSNITRGVLAEWLVGRLVGADLSGHRQAWDAFDLTAADGTTIEVKATADVQAWDQAGTTPSPARYGGLLTTGERRDSGLPLRAQVYVFGYLPKTESAYDPLKPGAWQWRVASAAEVRSWNQQSIAHSVLAKKEQHQEPVPDDALAAAVTAAREENVSR